jgi:Fic family protein
MKTTLEKVDNLMAALNALPPMMPEYQKKLDTKFRLEFNYNSNHLEGNTLTYGETELLLMFDDTKGNHTMREFEEMKAHDVAFKLVSDMAKEKEQPLTEQLIKNLNEIILVRPFWKEAITADGQDTRRLIKVGDYKEFPNSVRLQNGEIFEYASPTETPIKMKELIDWYRTEENNLDPVTLATMLHYLFVCIHPFDDGNGRVARLLMNFVLLRNNLPPVVIKSKDKAAYLQVLHLADVGDYEPLIEYISQQVIWSLELTLKASNGESIEEPDDIDKELLMWKKNALAKKTNGLRRNDDLVYDILSNGLNDLVVLFVKKHTLFFDMFQTYSVSYSLNTDSYNSIEELSEAIDNSLTNNVSSFVNVGELAELHEAKDNFTSISVSIDFEEYKLNPKNPFSIYSMLDIDFQPYKYVISHNADEMLEKDYYQNISLEEKDSIISKCMKSLLKQFEDEQNS